MGRHKVTAELLPFHLPNFLRLKGFPESVCVSEFSEEDMAAYWDSMREDWLEHCKHRRENKEPDQ